MRNPTKVAKSLVHRWLHIGMASLSSARPFLAGLSSYVNYDVKSPSELALTAAQAGEILGFLDRVKEVDLEIRGALQERIRISELQGDYSLQRKRELAESRRGAMIQGEQYTGMN